MTWQTLLLALTLSVILTAIYLPVYNVWIKNRSHLPSYKGVPVLPATRKRLVPRAVALSAFAAGQFLYHIRDFSPTIDEQIRVLFPAYVHYEAKVKAFLTLFGILWAAGLWVRDAFHAPTYQVDSTQNAQTNTAAVTPVTPATAGNGGTNDG